MPHSDEMTVLQAPVLEAPAAFTGALPESGSAEEDLFTLTARLEQLDRELLALIRHRTAVARQLPAARAAAARPGFHHAAELRTAGRFAALGTYGPDFAVLLLRLAR